MLKIHPVNTRNQGGGEHSNRSDREDLNDFVLVDVHKANGCVHQKVQFIEQKFRVAIEGINITQNLTGVFELIGA